MPILLIISRDPFAIAQQFDAGLQEANAPGFVERAERLLECFLAHSERVANRFG